LNSDDPVLRKAMIKVSVEILAIYEIVEVRKFL
jgi:hypothetical protein